MRKLILFLLVVCFSFSMLQVNVNASVNKSDVSNVIVMFENLQDKVTNSLIIEEDKYVYNETYIRLLVSEFDVDEFNQYYGTKWTNNSLADSMITSIEETSISNNPEPCGTYCKKNMSISRWNYDRYYVDKESTEDWAEELVYDVQHGIIGDITLTTAAGALTFGLGFVAGIWSGSHLAYQLGLRSALLDNNKGICGTVTDINKYTAVYTVRNQESFYE